MKTLVGERSEAAQDPAARVEGGGNGEREVPVGGSLSVVSNSEGSGVVREEGRSVEESGHGVTPRPMETNPS